MTRSRKVTTRELRSIRQDPLVLEAVQRYRRAARDWAGQIAVLEVRRDRDLGRREREIDDAEVEALTRLRRESEQARILAPEPEPEVELDAAVEPEPVEAAPPRRRLGWRRPRGGAA